MTLTEPPPGESTETAGRPTIPWSWYSDPAILAAEMDRIFHRSWLYAGHLGELEAGGGAGPAFLRESAAYEERARDQRSDPLRRALAQLGR